MYGWMYQRVLYFSKSLTNGVLNGKLQDEDLKKYEKGVILYEDKFVFMLMEA